MSRDRENREKQLFRCIPDILDYKTLLYIGARRRLAQMLGLFIKASYTIDILEIWRPNLQALKEMDGIRKVIEGDVRNILGMKLPSYDIVMWWHGPEHIQWRELYSVLKNLHMLSKKYAIIAGPWGFSPQGAKKGNIYERHITSLYPDTFKALGWEVDTIGKFKDRQFSNILAWRKSDV